MNDLTVTINNATALLKATREIDADLGNVYNKGYKSCIMYAIGKTKLYKCHVYIKNDKMFWEISVYHNFNSDEKLFDKHTTTENQELVNNEYRDKFINILSYDKKPEEHYTFSEGDNVSTIDGLETVLNDMVVNVYSPILTF